MSTIYRLQIISDTWYYRSLIGPVVYLSAYEVLLHHHADKGLVLHRDGGSLLAPQAINRQSHTVLHIDAPILNVLILMHRQDANDEIEFVFFDRVGKEIVGRPLILLWSGQSQNMPLTDIVQSARTDVSIPRELPVVVSNKYRFVVSVSTQSFDPEWRSSFQVHRIDAHLGKQSHSSALHLKPALPIVSCSKPALDLPPLTDVSLLTRSSLENHSS